MQSFVSISFLPEQHVTENDLILICKNILQSFGIRYQDFPYTILEFFIKCWYTNLPSHDNLPMLVKEMLDILEAVMSSKKIIYDCLSFLRQTLNDFLAKLITKDQLNDILINYARSVLANNSYFCQSQDAILKRHHRIIFEDNFLVLLAFNCLIVIPESLEKLMPEKYFIIKELINYITKLLNGIIDGLLKRDNPDYIKVLIRGWTFKDFIDIENLNGFMIEWIADMPPFLVPKNDFTLFEQITNSSTVRQAIELFIKDTLIKENPPFENEVEGLKMIYEGFQWTLNKGKVYYADLVEFAHGYSNDNYIFINYTYNRGNNFSLSFRNLTLLHESLHIYKRLGKNKNIRVVSPVNSFVNLSTGKRTSEDGNRFESFLIPNKGLKLYLGSAKFLNKIKSWNLDLEEFQKRFSITQERGETDGEQSMNFSKKSGAMEWPKCFRIPLINE